MNAFHWRGPSTTAPKVVKLGRPAGSQYSDEERAQRHREAALQWHHANKHKRRKA
jgi:hypothetical protein